MNPNKTSKLKLLIVGAFVAFSQFATGQSITAEHYEASGTETYLFPAPFFASNIRICAQDSVKLTASGFTGSSYTWTLPDASTSSVTSSIIWVKEEGNYTVSDGSSTASLYVYKESSKPEIYSSSYPVTEELLRAQGSDSNRVNPGSLFSFFSSSNKENFISPIGKEYTYNKQQYLITSSELTSMGFEQGSTLKSIGFYFNNSWSGCNSNGYSLRIHVYPTSLSAMSASFVTSGGLYLGDYGCDSHNQGWNFFDFGNNYTWDGTSDLVFDFSYYNESGSTTNPSIALDQTSFDATTISLSPNVDLRYNWPSASFVKSAGSYRPSISFKYSRKALKDTIVSCTSSIQLDVKNGQWNNTYTWSSTGGLSSTSSSLTATSSDLVYMSSVSSNLCLVQDTVQVLQSSVTTPAITTSSNDFCEGESVTLSTTIPSNHTASWTDASTTSSITVNNGGTYTVTLTNQYGCSKTSSEKVITEIKKPVLLKSANFVDVYANEEHTLEKTTGNYGTKNVKYFGDFGGKKYFISRDGVDSASYTDFIESNTGAEHVVIDNQALDQWMTSTHKELYDLSSNDYPYTLQTGVKWDESEQELRGIDGTVQTYESFWGNPANDLSSDKWFVRYHQSWTGVYWWETDNFDNGGFLISYSIADLTVQNGDVYCDSVQLFAPSSFSSVLWSTGETTESIWVSGSGSHSISLTGTYTKSDGTTCSLTSDTYTFTINSSPTLSIINNSSTTDLTGSNYIDLEADYTNGSTIAWSTGVTGDTINVYSAGNYSVTATLNGCSVTESINIYEPIYVAKTGNDNTGDGSYSSPYKTIQHGINQASQGGKVYVLPGTYEEQVIITKGIYLSSNFERLADSSALATTIIKPGSSAKIEDQNNSSYYSYGGLSIVNTSGDVTISGFTIKDFEVFYEDWWRSGALSINENSSYKVEIKNTVISGTVQKQGQSCCPSAHVFTANNSQNVIFDNVTIENSGSSSQDIYRLAYLNNVNIHATELILKNNYASGMIFRLSNSSMMTVVNSVFDDGLGLGWSQYPIWLEGGSDLVAINTTFKEIESNSYKTPIYISGSGSDILLLNTIIEAEEVVYNSGSSNTLEIVNSLVPSGADLDHSGLAVTIDSSNVIFGLAVTNSDYSLPSNSLAIGKGTNSHTWRNKVYYSPSDDMYGRNRPTPLGSSVDMGAVESSKAIGDFEILLTQCGYLLEASVLNSNAYSVAWLLNGDTVSTSESFTASSLGTYTLYTASTDRNATISESIDLTDPLRYDLVYATNNCNVLSSNNGEVRWGGATGGTRNTVDWWEYRSGINNENGSQFDGKWEIDEDTWYNTRGSMASGKYYVYIEDNAGCIVGDTIEIVDQEQDTYYVSSTGSDSNSGLTESDAFATVAQAFAGACLNDTIIILDGTYSEDSIFITRPVVIGSKYLLDEDSSHISNTVFSGGNNAAFYVNYVNSQYSDTSSMLIAGFTITDYSNPNYDQWYGHGGAISVWNSNVKIDHMIIQNNTARDGGGIGFMGHGFTGVVSNSIISGNQADLGGGGIKAELTGDLWIRNTQIDGNDANEGGGLWSRSWTELSNVELTNNTAVNYGGFYSRTIGSSNSSKSSNEWSRIKVTGNTSSNENGGGRFDKSGGSNSFTLINALIADNTSNTYPGIVFSGYDGNKIGIINSTIYNNTGANSGASGNNNIGIWDNTVVRLLNTIVGRSGGSSGYAFYGFNCGTQYLMADASSVIEGGANAVYDNPCGSNETKLNISGVLTSGVYFTDEASGDYSLAPVSSLLGQGSASNSMNFSSEGITALTLTAPNVDLNGNSRPNPSGSNPDVGAFENSLDEPQIGIAVVVDNNGFCQTNSASITANLLNYSSSATYSWSSSTYPSWTWNNTQSANGLASGDYKVIAHDATSGAKIDSTEITITTLPAISILNTSIPVTCFGDDDGELLFEIYGGNPLGGSQYSYQVDYLQSMAQATGVILPSNGNWFDSDTRTDNRSNKYNSDDWVGSPIYQGKYYVTVTDQDACTFSDTVEVGYSHELPEVNITTLASDGTSGLTSMCSGTGNTISLTANVSGGGGTNSFLWNNASTAQTVGVAQSDEYVIEVTDQYTCVGKDTIDIYFQSAPQLVVEGAGSPIYNGTALPSGVGSYSWGTQAPQYLGNYNGSAYYLLKDSYRSSDAIAIAEALGGRLATPRNKAENDWLLAEYTKYHCCAAMIGARYDGNTWVDFDGVELQWSHWWSNEVNGVGNPLHGNPATDDYDMAILHQSGDWHNYETSNYYYLLLEFPPGDAPVTTNQAFCDSIELKANSFVSSETRGFTEIYWTDALGDTINDLEYKTFYADQDITLHGVFTRSDGQTCEISSNTYTFDVFDSPNLVVTNYSGSVDLLGGDSIVLVASTDAGTVSWIDASGTVVNNDTLFVTAPGIYTAKATTANCESFEEIQTYEPIYVAKTGDDTNGDGTFASPYLTIQKGIDVANDGQKIYVLPGTYKEGQLDFETSSNSGIYKSVYIASNLVRIDDSTAISSTVIDADGEEYLIRIEGDNSTVIQGFTLTGQETGPTWESTLLYLRNGASLTFRDLIIEDNTSVTYQQESQVLNARYQSHVVFDNVLFRNNASSSNQTRIIAFVYNYASASFYNCTWEGNYGWESMVRIQSNSSAYFENNYFKDNGGGDWGIVDLQESNCTVTFMNSTIVNNLANNQNLLGISGSNNSINFINSILEESVQPQKQIRNNTSTSNTFFARNSVLANDTLTGALYPAKLNWDIDNTVVFANPQIDTDGSLLANSPAIGIGTKQPVAVGSTTYTPPTTDLAGVTRPDPNGSNPDAGAYESDKAIGDFDILLSQCGYLLEVNVLNSNAYTVAWLFNGDTVSTDESFIASNLGTYSVSVNSTDRSSSLSENINLSNPLTIGNIWSKNNCSEVSSNNGEIEWGTFSGGTVFTSNWWEYYTGVKDDDGNVVRGEWEADQFTWNNHEPNFSPGTYYVYVRDASGCEVGDTVIILDQDQELYYVSNSGSDSNDGLTKSTAFKTIGYAATQVCDLDQIVVLEGTYSEDSIFLDRKVILASEIYEDGDTSHIANTIIRGGNQSMFYYKTNSSNWSDTATSQIRGFTLYPGSASNYNEAAGISRTDQSVVKIKDVVIDSLSGSGYGAVKWNDSPIAFENVEIKNGSGLNNAIIYTYYSSIHIDNLAFTNNIGSRLLDVRYSHSFTATDLKAKDNYLSSDAFYIYYPFANFDIHNVEIVDNKFYSAFNFYYGSSNQNGELSNALIAGNNTTSGSVIRSYQYRGNFILNHNTIVDNYDVYGGGIRSIYHAVDQNYSGTAVRIVGNILQSGDNEAIKINDYSTFAVNAVNNLTDGSNLISTNSLTPTEQNTRKGVLDFDINYTPTAYNQALGGSKLSVTAGGSVVAAPAIDLKGNNRPWNVGEEPDMGAIESPLDTFDIGIKTVAIDNGFCETNDGQIEVTTLNYSAAKSYYWSSLDDATWTYSTSDSVAIGLVSGQYVVEVRDTANSLIGKDTVVVATKSTIAITNESTNASCFARGDGQISFNLSGGSPFGGGQYYYSLTFLDAALSNPADSASNSGYDFTGIDYSMGIPGPSSYTTSSTANVYQGQYYLSVSDVDGCAVDDTISIGYNFDLPVLSIDTYADNQDSSLTSLCEGSTIELIANAQSDAGSITYEWSTNANTQKITKSSTGEYYVTVRDGNSCYNSDTIEIYFQTAPELVLEGAGLPNYSGGALTGQFASSATYLGSFNGSHYYYVNDWQQWETAKSYAESLGGHLARPESKEEAEALFAMKQNVDCCNGNYIDILWNNNRWEYSNGEPITFNYFQGNYQQGQGTYSGSSTNNHIEINGTYYGSLWYTDTRPFLIEFDPVDAPVAFNQAFCDSVQLMAKPYSDGSGKGFSEIYWTDAQGDTIADTEYFTFTSDQDITLHGVFTRSDGQICSLSSSSYSFDVFDSPNLVVTNYSGSVDLLGGDTIVLVATTDAGNVSWIDSAGTVINSDTLLVNSPGTYTARAVTSTCESVEEIQIYQPIYVAKTGNDNTGDGSFTNPFLTIQKGIDIASEGQKIYVLPGTYKEGELNFEMSPGNFKSVFIASDFVRLGNSAAIGSTKIDADGDDKLINIRGANTSIIQGFTLTGQETSQWESSVIYLSYNANVVFKDIEIKGNVWNSDANAHALYIYNSSPRFENVLIQGHGSANSYTRATTYITGGSTNVEFINVIWKDNFAWDYGVLGVWSGATVTAKNNLFINNGHSSWRGIINIHNQSTVNLINSTVVNNLSTNEPQLVSFWDASSTTTLNLINTVLGQSNSEDYQIYNNGGNSAFVNARNSVLPYGISGSNQPSKITWDVDTSNVFTNPQLNLNGTLKDVSPAIGIGTNLPVTIGSMVFNPLNTDLAGVSRPDPAGSKPDAGAYESDKAIGDFDLLLSQCGYLITAQVANSSNYTLDWKFGGAIVQSGTALDYLAQSKGQYVVTAYSVDRADTISKTIALTNPLEFEFSRVKDVCESNGSNSGHIYINNYSGANNNPNDWWEYRMDIFNSDGSQVWGNHFENNYGEQGWSNATAGMYYVQLQSYNGCSVGDSVELKSIQSNTWWLSTTGSDLNNGTTTSPLATIEEAMLRACDGDTIILKDGTYYENVDLDWSSSYHPMVVIGSEYILDSNISHVSNTILDGMNDATTIAVQRTNWYGSDTIKFVGFTVQNGKSSTWPGGGGFSIRESFVALEQMIVSDNESGNNGGGIAVNSGQVSFKNTIVENNYTSGNGGGIWIEYQNEEIVALGDSGLIVRYNYSENDGGGIYYQQGLWNSQDSYGFENVKVQGNIANYTGGGIFFNTWDGNASLMLKNAIVTSNIAKNNHGGGIYVQSGGGEVEFSNLIVSQNKSNSAGGIYVHNSDLILISSTIYENPTYSNSPGTNSAITLDNTSDLHLWNTIVGGQNLSPTSTGWIINTDDYSNHTIEFENAQVEGGLAKVKSTSSTGTITLNPTTGPQISQTAYLMNPQNGDFRPSPASQAIGSGSIITSSSTLGNYSVPLTDIYGVARPNPTGSSIDLGAVETEDSTFIYGAALQVRNNIACDPAFGRIKATALNGQGSPRYTFTDLTGNLQWSTFVNQPSATITSLPNGFYRLKVEDVVGTTVVNEYVDTIQIVGKDSLDIIMTATDEFCYGDGDGSIIVTALGGNGAYEYTWTTLSGGLSNKTSILSNLSPNRYIVSVKDGDGCFAVDSVELGTLHQLPTVSITSNLSQGGVNTVGGSDVRACIGDVVTLDAGSGYFAYAWTTSNQLNTITTQSINAPYNETFYVEVTDQYGCKNSDTSSVYFVQRPLVFASNVNQAIGQAGQQVTAYVEGGNQRSSDYNDGQVYGTDYTYGKFQYIIPANELISSGMTEQTTINSLGMEVTSATGEPIQNFKIKLKHTNKNQANNQFENSGFTEVLSFPLMTVGEGWNTHNFTTPFEWNGTNNLLVEITYATTSFNAWQGDVSYVGSSYSYNTTSFSQQNSQIIGTYAPNVRSFRPNMKFGIDKIQATDTLRVCDFTMLNTTDDYDAYSWLVDGTSAGTQLRYSVLQPKEVILQTTDVASGCVMYSDTIQVLLDTTPAVVLVDESIAMCSGDTVYGMVNNVDSDLTYWWSNSDTATTTALYSGNDYYIYAQAPSGCTGIDTLQVIENIPPDVIIELNGRVLTTTDGSIVNTSSAVTGCDTLFKLPYAENVETLTDNSLNGWTTYSSQGLTWDVEPQWDTIQDFTGPTYDADSNSTGNWFQFDPAAITDENKVGYLQSNCISLLGVAQPYMTFEYHMSDVYADSSNTSDQMGSLYVEVKNISDNGQWNTVFAKSGSQGLDWINHSMSLYAYAGKTIQIRFKAQAGVGGSRSEIGLDNINLNAYDLNNTSTAPSLRLDPLTVCEGDSLKATAISNGSQTFNYVWNTGDTTDYLVLHTSGYYHAVIVDDKNCEVGTDSVYIEVNPAPNTIVSLSDTTMYCDGDFNGISLSAVQGYRNYEWSQVTDSGAVSTADSVDAISVSSIDLGTNSYYVVITDSIGCQATSLPVDLILNPNPAVVLTASDVLCYGESNGAVVPTIAGSGGYDYVWSTGDTTASIDSLIIGTYTLTVTDSFSCASVDSITVDQPSVFTYTVTSVEDVKCYNGSDGMATYNVGGGVGGYSYAWTDSTNTWTTTGKDLQFAPIGTYYVSAQDSNGCEILDTVRIEQPNELVLTLDSTKNLDCYQSGDGAVWASVVGGIGGNEYRLNGATVSDVDVAQLSAGFYTLTVEDDNGCMDSVSFTLTEPQLLTATNYTSQYVGGYQISCNGNTDGFIQVDVSGGTMPYTYAWTDSVNTEDRSNIGAGNYTLQVTDTMGCEVYTSANLFEPSQLVASSTLDQLLCHGDSTAELTYSVSGGVGPYVTNWSSLNGTAPDSVNVTFQVDLRGASPDTTGIRLIRNGGGTFVMSTVSALNDSIYRVTLTMAPGEQIMYRFFNGSAAETVNPSCGINNSVSVIERTFTAGMNDTSLAVVGFSECTTYGGSRSGAYVDYVRNIVGLASDVYYQTFIDLNGCSITLVDTVSEPDPLVLTIDSISNVTCKDASDASVAVTVTGGNGNYSYTWNGAASSTEDLSGVGAGQYTLVVVDDKGCTDSVSVTITEPDSLLASYVLSAYVGGNNVSCNGATDGSFDVSVQGGTMPYAYDWNTLDTTQDLSGIGQGYYSVVITDANGCTVSVGDSIVQPDVLTASISTTDVLCNGGTDGTVTVNVAGGSGPYSVNWTASNGGQNNSAMGITFRVNMSGQTVDPSGVDVVLGTGQVLDMVTYDDSVYYATGYFNQGDSIKYRFFNGSISEVVPVTCGVTQNLTLFERLLVVGNDTTLPTVYFSSCNASQAGTSGYAISGTDSLTAVTAGTYSAIITDANGCTITVQDSVAQPDLLVITTDTVVDASCPQNADGYIGVIVNGGTGNYDFDWSSGDVTQNVTVGYGYHTLIVTDDNGCQDSATFFVDAPFPYNDEEVCVVTVDSTGVNLVVWEKTPNQKTAEYVILRENASTQFVSIGSNQYNDMSTFVDQNSNPKVQPYRYQIALMDSCGNYSDTSDFHSTIHLQASQGVASNEVNLQWTAYEGKQVQTYYIYRWLSPINRVLIDSVSSSVQTYTDIYPVNTAITALLYEVGAKFTNGGCSPSTGKQATYVNSMSNVLDWGADGGLPIGTEEWVDVVLNSDLEIFPNPTLGRLNLALKGAWKDQKDINIKIVDITGRTLAHEVVDGAGTVQFDFTELPAGIYFINIITEEGRTIVKRFERIN